ncbi:hypothetical protein, partial [Tenacibaculum sp. L6]
NFISILFFLTTILTYSQSSFFIVQSNPDTEFVRTSSGLYKMTNPENEIKRLYYFKSFKNKAVIKDSKKEFKINNFNIDLVDNNFVSKINNDTIFVFNELNKAFINNKEFIKKDNIIYEILVNGDRIELKVKHFSEKRDEIIDNLTGKILKPKHYIPKKEYVLLDKSSLKTSTFKKIKKKNIINLVDNEFKNDLIRFSKKEKLSFKNEKELKKILNYYNSL